MSKPKFVHVIYIRTTPEKLWTALTTPEFTRKYWCDTVQKCDWKKGSTWQIVVPDGSIADAGEVLEIDPPKRLVLTWRNEFRPELKAEGFSQLTYELEQVAEAVKLTVTHEIDLPDSKFLKAVSNGWPMILASLKSLLETGEPLSATTKWNPCK